MLRNTLLKRMAVGILWAGPLVLFVVLRLAPTIDSMWSFPIFHFYVVSFTSLVALVTGSFVLLGIETAGWRDVFSATAFLGIAALFTIHGLATPDVLIPGFNQAVGWSARLSLTVGAGFIGLSTLNVSPERQEWASRNRRNIWLVLGIVLAVYVWVAFSLTDLLARLAQIELLNGTLALLSAALFIWGAWHAGRRKGDRSSRLRGALVLALPWLALAQISQYIAPLYAMSWWLYHILMLAAFIVVMAALALDYETVLDFRLNRYFVSIGIIMGVPLIGLLSEGAVRLAGSEAVRWPMFGFSLIAGAIIFAGLLLIVRRAESVLDERAEALKAEKQWRIDFTNLIVHDLKTPLSVILMTSDLILSEKIGQVSEEQQVRLNRMYNSGTSMLELIDTLLDIERLEAGTLHLTLARSNMDEILQKSIDGIRELAERNNVRIVSEISDHLPAFEMDETLIVRVVTNLLANAAKFAPANSVISVAARVDLRKVTVSVTDEGPGVPPHEREHIFEKFAQVADSGKKGIGLGLTFCKLAVNAHGGTIWVEDAPGKSGSRFAFTLPASLQSATSR